MVEAKTLTICYTDISGSSELNTQLGNDRMKALKDEHFRIAEELSQRNSGKVVKRLGDGILCYFNNPSNALRFSSELQWIEKDHPGLVRWNFDIKIGLSHGEIILDRDDIDGTAANLGSRVQGSADVGQILLDGGAYKALISQWGLEKVKKYCKSIGEKPLKGLGNEKLWEFDWEKFDSDEEGVAKLVQEQLDCADFEITNTQNVPLSKGGKIFWPVVPRKIATAIHRGQLEAIKLLSFCEWTTHLFIADSNNLFEDDSHNTSSFKDKIMEFAEKIGVSINQVEYMSEIFSIDSEEFPELLSLFKKVTSSYKIDDIFNYEGKSYENKDEHVRDKSIMAFLRPIFTFVAFQQFVKKNPEDHIMVISGNDERTQWNDILTKESLFQRVNLTFNPELKKGEHLMCQIADWPIWLSRHQFEEQLEGTNLLEWSFNLFVLLPTFPSIYSICDKFCTSKCDKLFDGSESLYEGCENFIEIKNKLIDSHISKYFGWS